MNEKKKTQTYAQRTVANLIFAAHSRAPFVRAHELELESEWAKQVVMVHSDDAVQSTKWISTGVE